MREKTKDVLNTFIKNLPCETWVRHEQPKFKTIQDKMRAMLKERKDVNEKNAVASRIAEDMGPVDELLDDLLSEKK